MKKINVRKDVLDRICGRAHYLTTQMIHIANHRTDKEKGDPKVGGHPAACASSLHLTGALHLVARTGFDFIANKPHAAPMDHAWNYLLDLLLDADLQPLSLEDANRAMHGLRAFPQHGEPVFQSYHSVYDSDHHGFLPSGTVGIPPVNVGYLAHAYRFLKDHGYEVPEAHFWAVLGDSEFREGSVYEAVPDFAERELGNLTWIIDYNRQSLDGHRITNKEIMNGTDDQRIERTMAANGWQVIQVKHGHKRLELFKRPDGDKFREFLDHELQDYEFQALLLVQDMAALRKGLEKAHPQLSRFLSKVSDTELYWGLRDLGGHDLILLAEAMQKSRESKRKPTLIIAHTLKGWGLRSAAAPGNHSSLPSDEEVDELRKAQSLPEGQLFARFTDGSDEGAYLLERGQALRNQILEMQELKARNQKKFMEASGRAGSLPVSLDINLKMASYPHTQWMLGQCTAKLTRIANTSTTRDGKAPKGQKDLSRDDLPWKPASEMLVSMAPDVGTSTNLNPAMDGKIFGATVTPDWETNLGVKDRKTPDLVPGEEKSDRFLRFEIAEGNVMSCMGSYGKIRDFLGIPLLPLMTVYDFFIKRAHDQYFYNLYWKSSFILVGTPSGVTLSPEGAQHGWKSDFQIPNQLTWEPFFCQELDWILSDTIRRHLIDDNEGRSGVLIRGVTRGVDQKLFLHHLKRQKKFKKDSSALLHPQGFEIHGAVDESTVQTIDEEEIMESVRHDVLAGAYYLIDYRGYAGYDPGDNVVCIFAMGAVATEAIKASEELLARGIFANVIVVTSPDLVCGIQAYQNDHQVLKERLEVDGRLHLHPSPSATDGSDQNHSPAAPISAAEAVTLSGRRVPIVSVHDGEAGLLDNIGSVVGVRHHSLAVRKHSRCGRPKDVFAYHQIDAPAIIETCGKVLSETALETLRLSPQLLAQISEHPTERGFVNWRDFWPPHEKGEHH